MLFGLSVSVLVICGIGWFCSIVWYMSCLCCDSVVLLCVRCCLKCCSSVLLFECGVRWVSCVCWISSGSMKLLS